MSWIAAEVRSRTLPVATWRVPRRIAYDPARKARAVGNKPLASSSDVRRLIGRESGAMLSYVGLWLAVVLVSASANATITDAGLGDWTGYFLLYGGYWSLWAIATPVIYALIAGSRGGRVAGRGLRLAMHGVVLLLLVLASNLYFLAYNAFVAGLASFDAATFWKRFTGGGAVLFIGVHALKYAVIALISSSIWQRRQRVREEQARTAAELESRSLAVQLADARIASLREQLHPHFLFNALNCIASLIEIQRNSDAYAAVSDLATLLRQTLEMVRRQTVTLREDVEHARSYLKIAELRFGDQLRWRIDMEEDCAEVPVPPLLLQPLVENSVKHAASQSDVPVLIVVSARAHPEGAQIIVSDDGPGFGGAAGAASGTRIGLENLRQRLGLLYGVSAHLAVEALPSGRGARTCIVLPRQPLSTAAGAAPA